MYQQDTYWMTQRQALKAGLATHAGNHMFRATGITAYLKNKGFLGARADQRQPLITAHDQALQPPIERDYPGRSREGFDWRKD